jgi:hypothetical protein
MRRVRDRHQASPGKRTSKHRGSWEHGWDVSVAIASIGRPDLLDLMRQALGQRHAAVKVKDKN